MRSLHTYRRILRDYGSGIVRFVLASRVLTPLVRWMGFVVLSDHFYHPIPSVKTLRSRAASHRPSGAIDWRADAQRSLLVSLVDRFGEEFRGRDPVPDSESSIHGADAAVLYAMVRDARPRRVVEIGSGGSTRIIAEALARNHADGESAAELVTIDPSPHPWLETFAAGRPESVQVTVHAAPVQEADPAVFDVLGKNDILFVDSSHVFKPGSDVEYEFLRIYPGLVPGVRVHIHDIFFPFDYPLDWNLRQARFWNEQYFLETFLQCNHRFEVSLSVSYLAAHAQEEMARVPGHAPTDRPGSFWMRCIA